ncbi:hypothetical protein MKX01_034429 [Papaver californicum]|nr:hypothetical protein MKX01_034429 [Papaver californicum]
MYTVKPGDGLDHIARTIFSLLVTYQEIAAVNNITDPNLIEVGQSLWIPLRCSCDNNVDENQVVHYGHVVPPKVTLEMIANEFGATEKTCTSMVSNTSSDYPLLLTNGTYTYTANNCIKCSCDVNNPNWNLFPKPDIWTLHCEPSLPEEVKVQNWQQCPSSQCINGYGLPLGQQFVECPKLCLHWIQQSVSKYLYNLRASTITRLYPSIKDQKMIFDLGQKQR